MSQNKQNIKDTALLDFVKRFELSQKAGSQELRLSLKEAASLSSAIIQLSLNFSEANQYIIELQKKIIDAQDRALKAEEDKIIKVTVDGGSF